MLDINFIRERPDLVKASLKKRGMEDSIVDEFLKLDTEWRSVKKINEELRSDRNKLSIEINNAKKLHKDISLLVKKTKELPVKITQGEEQLAVIENKRTALLENFPNLVDKSVPLGNSSSNKVIFRSAPPKKNRFKPRGHEELLLGVGGIDLRKASEISGSRFYYLKREIVRLNYAIISFTLDFLVKKNFILVQPPYMIKKKSLQGAIPLSIFEEMIYKIEDEDLFLIGTAEHALNAIYFNELINGKDLPIRLAGVSPCFRKEAGSHGKDTKGIFRTHQFEKIEQFVFCRQEDSWNEFNLILNNSKQLLSKLKIPFRFVVLSSQELGRVATKTVDFEGWFPSQKEYKELGSCSNCLDYQSRRTNTKYDFHGTTKFVHTLNNTAIATERMICCIVENYQLKDGSIKVPSVLSSYMNNIRKISPIL